VCTADLWDADNQQYAVAYVVFSSVFGSVLGPIIGGFVEQYLAWRWSIWIQLIFGGFVQIAHFFLVPETRTTIIMDRIAKKRRKATGENIWGPNELEPFRDRFSAKEILITWMRPFKMFVTEPIVLTLSLLSGFSDALIFMFIQSFSLVYGQWNFSAWAVGLSFLPLGIGYFVAWMSFIPAIRRNIKQRENNPGDEKAQYESRLWWLLYTAPTLPIGLFGFAWTIQGPPVHWIGSMIFAGIVGIANYSIYMATVDYMICAYGPYSASATGGNGWARDFLAGVLTIPATPFFTSEYFAVFRSFDSELTIIRHRWPLPSRLCCHNSCLHCHSTRPRRLRYLLVWTNTEKKFALRPVACRCQGGQPRASSFIPTFTLRYFGL
jgi:MFS family permease